MVKESALKWKNIRIKPVLGHTRDIRDFLHCTPFVVYIGGHDLKNFGKWHLAEQKSLSSSCDEMTSNWTLEKKLLDSLTPCFLCKVILVILHV